MTLFFQENAQKTQKIPLNNSDSMFKDIRDYHFDSIGSVLHDRAAVIQEAYKEKDTAQSISQISKFMKKFKHLHQVCYISSNENVVDLR